MVKNRQYLRQDEVSRSGCLVTKDASSHPASEREISPRHSAVSLCVTQLPL